MRFDNQTPLPATVVRTAERNDCVSVLVVCGMTCAVDGEALRLSREQRPLLTGPMAGAPNDVIFVADRGVSVTATGFVYPERSGDRSAFARLRVAERRAEIRAFGPRVWQRSLGGSLVPSSPRHLEPVPMSWSRAFGGIVRRPTSVSETDGEEVLVPPHEASYPANPDGVGFYLGEEEAENQPLPALEWADAPIRTWNDYPEPACFAPYPLYGGLRGEFVIRGGKVDRSRLGRLTSRATPRLSFDTLAPGAPVELWGMRPARESLRFAIPRSPGVAVVDVGQDGSSIPLVLDAVDIDAEASSVRFVFRAMLSYALVQHERRVIRLVPTDALPPEPGRRLP